MVAGPSAKSGGAILVHLSGSSWAVGHDFAVAGATTRETAATANAAPSRPRTNRAPIQALPDTRRDGAPAAPSPPGSTRTASIPPGGGTPIGAFSAPDAPPRAARPSPR